MRQHPLRHDRAAAADDADEPLGGERNVFSEYAGVDGEVVHALFGLFDEGFFIDFPCERFDIAATFWSA
jgi:hypothetical protein